MPALPIIADDMAISNHQAQQIIMLYFIGFGLSQLVYGPWSDRVGRRKVFFIGQSLFILGGLICTFTSSPIYLAIGRVLQGIGAGAPLIVSRTILSVQFEGFQLKKTMATLGIVASIVAVCTPFIGGWITNQSSWQVLFLSFSGYLLVNWWLGFYLLPRRKSRPRPINVRFVIKQYRRLLTDQKFLVPSLFKWLPTLIYLTSSTFLPFELQKKLELSPQEYGAYMMIPTLGLILGTSTVKLMQRYISYPIILALFGPLILAAGCIFCFLPFTLFNCLFAYSLFMICTGAYYTASLHLLIEPFRQSAGSVNALSGAIEMFVFSALAILINRVWITDTHELGILYLIVFALLTATWTFSRYYVRPNVDNNDLSDANNNLSKCNAPPKLTIKELS